MAGSKIWLISYYISEFFKEFYLLHAVGASSVGRDDNSETDNAITTKTKACTENITMTRISQILVTPPPLSLSQISWFCSFHLLFGDPPPPPAADVMHIWKPPWGRRVSKKIKNKVNHFLFGAKEEEEEDSGPILVPEAIDGGGRRRERRWRDGLDCPFRRLVETKSDCAQPQTEDHICRGEPLILRSAPFKHIHFTRLERPGNVKYCRVPIAVLPWVWPLSILLTLSMTASLNVVKCG